MCFVGGRIGKEYVRKNEECIFNLIYVFIFVWKFCILLIMLNWRIIWKKKKISILYKWYLFSFVICWTSIGLFICYGVEKDIVLKSWDDFIFLK